KTVVAFMDELTNIAMKETKNNGVFTLPGFGKLRKVNRKARMGRNPQTGEAIKIPAKTVVRFRVSKACKEAAVGKK
ncbi:MAG: HU family DNA-binding protein, partial [Candidatus Acidiferrales bacterium]